MDGFDEILRRATAAVPRDYFQLPVHGATPVYRERVYCYELYHQLRMLMPVDSRYRLNGEVDKRAHALFAEHDWAPKPDFLLHVPGTNDNYAVVEVKSADRLRSEGPGKDLDTLQAFHEIAGYTRTFFLVFGDTSNSLAQYFQRAGVTQDSLGRIELWVHAAASVPAEPLVIERSGG